MGEEKSICVSFRVTPRFKRVLQAAAECEHWSQTHSLETLLFERCLKSGQSLMDTRLRTEFFKHLPGIFTGLGIIGTLTGLVEGLRRLQSVRTLQPCARVSNR